MTAAGKVNGVVVVATDGVGCAVAQELSRTFRVSLIDCSEADACRVVECRDGRSRSAASPGSGGSGQVEATLAEIWEREPRPDALIVVAGASEANGRPEDGSAYQESLERNFFLPLTAMKSVLPRLCAARAGKIIVLIPASGLFVDRHGASVACAHWALRRVCQSLQAETGPTGVDVHLMFMPRQKEGAAEATHREHAPRRLATDLARILSGTSRGTVHLRMPDRLRYVKRQVVCADPLLGRRADTNGHGPRSAPRRVVITGASSGLGAELARCHAEHGDSVYLVGRNVPAMERLRGELPKDCEVHIDRVDLADGEATSDYAGQLAHVDVLINCAGFSVVGEVMDVSVELFRRNMTVNFLAPVLLTEALCRKDQPPHRVVNVLSTTAISGRKNHGSYAASKAALWAYTKILRRTLSSGTEVMEVLPATFASSFASNTVHGRSDKESAAPAVADAQHRHGLTSQTVAAKVYSASERGDRYLFVPYKARMFHLLEAVTPALFRRMFP